MKYVIGEIGGRQYIIKPGITFDLDKQLESEKLTVDKVLLSVDENKIEIGKPYLDQKIVLQVLGNKKKAKIRVAKYTAKANSRTVTGSRREVTQVRLAGELEK